MTITIRPRPLTKTARSRSHRKSLLRTKIRGLALIATLIPAALTLVPAAPASAIPAGYYWISAPGGRMCLGLDSRYDQTADMSLVAVKECNFAEPIYWYHTLLAGTAGEFRNFYSGKCLDIAAAARAENAAAVQYSCWGATAEYANQQWQIFTVRDGTEGLSRVVNWHSYLCLTRTGLWDNAVVVQRPCAPNDPANEWRVETAPWIG